MENQPKPVQSDEIDLGVLFSKIGDFFRNLGMSFLRALAVLRLIPSQNKILFISLTTLAILSGYFYSSGLIVKKYYETSMILSSEYLNKRILDNSVEKLNLLADEKNKAGLAKVLQIPESTANGILKFKAKPFIAEKEVVEIEVLKEQLKNASEGKKNEKAIAAIINQIEIENRHSYEITVFVDSPSTIVKLEAAVLAFFKREDYIKHRIEITRNNLLAKKEKLKNESEKLDSLKNVIFQNYQSMALQSRQGSNNVILSDKAVTDPIEIYKQDKEVYNELQNVEKALYLQPDFEIVSGFTEFSEPASPGTVKSIFIAVLAALALGYIMVGLINFNKYLASLS